MKISIITCISSILIINNLCAIPGLDPFEDLKNDRGKTESPDAIKGNKNTNSIEPEQGNTLDSIISEYVTARTGFQYLNLEAPSENGNALEKEGIYFEIYSLIDNPVPPWERVFDSLFLSFKFQNDAVEEETKSTLIPKSATDLENVITQSQTLEVEISPLISIWGKNQSTSNSSYFQFYLRPSVTGILDGDRPNIAFINHEVYLGWEHATRKIKEEENDPILARVFIEYGYGNHENFLENHRWTLNTGFNFENVNKLKGIGADLSYSTSVNGRERDEIRITGHVSLDIVELLKGVMNSFKS